ncbi:MAG: pilus assembly protein [Alphaproteobacteria bacterium]|nr:pilus assembly protein [Alphaproteobacteria bacterium]
MFRLLACLRKHLVRPNRGSLGVEFAILAPFFLLLLFAIIESGLLLLNSVVLEGAAQEAGRQVRTGSVQNAGSPEVEFKRLLCENLYGIMPCTELTYIVSSFPDFATANIPDMYDANGNQIASSYQATSPGDIVVVRVARPWNFITPIEGLLSLIAAQSHSGSYIGWDIFRLQTTVVFRNEPFNPPGT